MRDRQMADGQKRDGSPWICQIILSVRTGGDNVVRGGLTGKHVDIQELLRVVTYRETEADILKPREAGPLEKVFHTPSDEFRLSVISLSAGDIYESATERSVEILLVTEGEAFIGGEESKHPFLLERGRSVIVPAAVSSYRMEGTATLYKATVPV